MTKSYQKELWELGFQTIKELETENGILASGREEAYGCIFGRDSLITSLKLLRVYEKTNEPYFLDLVRKVLLNLADLQGKDLNVESGEEPGKCIHEFRPLRHEHLTARSERPWYVYPDGTMRNYDSVDSTPLFLIAIHRFIEVGGDRKFRSHIEPFVAQALEWLDNYGDSNQDRFIDYQFRPERKYGGLVTQNWMDSSEAVFHETGDEVVYPVAPVEVQAYAYLALHLWGKNEDAERLKELFNQKFIHDGKLASAIDGRGRAITSARSSVGHCLWAARVIGGGKVDSIVADQYIPAVVGSLLSRELFEPAAGIRTLSTASRGFNPQSYHNGSIWPHDNSLIAEGLENFGFYREARAVREAMLSAISHFQTPIEMFAYQDGLREYCSSSGQTACRKQAWSAASLLCDIAWL